MKLVKLEDIRIWSQQRRKERGWRGDGEWEKRLEQAEIDSATFYRIRKKNLVKDWTGCEGKSAKVWKEEDRESGGGRRVAVGQSRSRKNSNLIEFYGQRVVSRHDRNTMISPRDIDTDVEVVESRAVESSTWLERGRKPAQTRYAISFVRAQTETRQLISQLLDKISG